MKKTFTATEARKNFYQLLRQAAKPGARITITLKGEDPLVIMSQDELDGWMETLAIMSDPQLVKDIREAKKEKGGIDWEDLKKELNL